MAFDKVYDYFKSIDMSERVLHLDESTATVDEAAQALGCEPDRIAKTLSFYVGEQPILVLTAGKARIDNKKYKAQFHKKAKMIPADEVEEAIGHDIGGVCPFAINEGVDVYLDESLKTFDFVYPAAGDPHSAVKLYISELEEYSNYKEWVDICK